MHILDKDRCYWLDWVRFLAALEVLVSHARGGYFVEYGSLPPDEKGWAVAVFFGLSRLGHESVIVFFVLSGYLVGGRSLQRVAGGRFDIASYWLDRATRIYVPLLPILILTIPVNLVRGKEWSIIGLLVNLAGLQGTGPGFEVFGGNEPLWSLAYEMWFYACWGGGLALATSRSAAHRVGWFFLTAVSLVVICKLENPHYFFCWVLGALIRQVETGVLRRSWLLGLGLMLAVTGGMMTQLNSGSTSFNLQRWQAWIPGMPTSVLILGVGFALAVHLSASWIPSSESARCWERRGKLWADFSYTMYLSHFVIIALWGTCLPDRRVPSVNRISCSVFIAKVAVLIAVSWLLYYMFERNTGKVRRWLRDRFDRLNTPQP